MKIAVDAMGGDFAPQSVIEGVLQARSELTDVEFTLYGDEAQIKPLIDDMTRLTIVHTTEKITSEDEPVRAIRRKKQASMVLAAQAVKDGEADALFSLGNTGALLAAGLFVIGRIKGIDRPGLMPTLPAINSDVRCWGQRRIKAGAFASIWLNGELLRTRRPWHSKAANWFVE